MCDSLTFLVDEDFGSLYKLCDGLGERVKCIAKNRLYIESLPQLQNGNLRRSALVSVLEAMCENATHFVIEPHYFDLDYRSEFSITHESSFRARTPGVSRFHFFKGDASPAEDSQRLRDFVADNENNYLGYVIVRPQPVGIIGRSVVNTDVTHRDYPELGSLGRHVRTRVHEFIQLYGVRLTADGIAFMEQDGHLLRCAHVSAWICHYSAVLRGLVSRRSTAEFHGSDDGYAPYGRVYPSQGLTVNSLTASLRRVGLPPEILDLTVLRETREPKWHDTIESGYWPLEDANEDDERFWVRKNLTEFVCRYLNSGVGCVIAREEQLHTQVAIGYLRKEDFEADANKRKAIRSDVTHLLVSDDQQGPFEIISIDELVDEIYEAEMTSIIVPLPRPLLLGGAAAEEMAALLFEAFGGRALDSDEENSDAVSDIIKDFCASTTSPTEWDAGETIQSGLTIRTYATTGTDFKESWVRRLSEVAGKKKAVNAKNLDVVRLVSHIPLPKYVWVSECVDRKKRKEDSPFVVRGTVVLDAFDTVTVEGQQSNVTPLFIHVPGHGYVTPAAETSIAAGSDDLEEVDTSLQPYRSGRPQDASYFSPERVAERAKSATTRF